MKVGHQVTVASKKALLIGSSVYANDPKDIDLLCNEQFIKYLGTPDEKSELTHGIAYTYKQNQIIDAFVPKEETARHWLLNRSHNQINLLNTSVGIATLPELAALKKAHLIMPHKFKTNIQRYSQIKNLLGVTEFNPEDFGVSNLYRLHRQECLSISKKHPKLNVTKNNFFEDAEFKIFDHDSIHIALGIENIPAYTLIQDGEVWCSKDKWDKLTHEKKMQCVIEEASILALERSIIPALYLNRKFVGAAVAYSIALEKMICGIVSNWFREFIIEYYDLAIKMQPDYINLFFNGLKKGLIKIIKYDIVLGV